MTVRPRHLALAGLLTLAATALAACSMGGGPASPAGLNPALSARMDQPGARLDPQQAVALINAYRTSNGVAPLAPDAGLNGTAQALADQYARTGTAPAKPQALTQMKLSAGYSTFAETFSGWRNNPADAAGLLARAGKAGVAVANNPASAYGVYWVLVIGN